MKFWIILAALGVMNGFATANGYIFLSDVISFAAGFIVSGIAFNWGKQ